MLTRVATGDISPSRAVKIDTAGDGLIAQSGAGERSIGISCPWTRRTPALGMDDGYAAISGENLAYYCDGDKDVRAEYGGTVAAGDRLKATTGGKLIATTTDKDQYIAVAKVAGVDGEIGIVDVTIGEVSV